jgi:hypothetical protein
MRTGATAGIEFISSSMRYAEVEQIGNHFRLLRLGNCDFEFDVADVLFGSGSSVYLDTISRAVGEVFEGSSAATLRVTVHSPAAHQFGSAAQQNLSDALRQDHAVFDAAIVTGHEVDPEAVRSSPGAAQGTDFGDEVELLQVAALQPEPKERLSVALSRVGIPNIELISDSEAVSRVIRALCGIENGDFGTTLAIGIFPWHTCYTVYTNGLWVFGQDRTESDSDDILYFSTFVCRQAGFSPEKISRVFVYGETALEKGSESLKRVYSERVEILNPISILNLSPDQFADGFGFQTIVSCIGAAL